MAPRKRCKYWFLERPNWQSQAFTFPKKDKSYTLMQIWPVCFIFFPNLHQRVILDVATATTTLWDLAHTLLLPFFLSSVFNPVSLGSLGSWSCHLSGFFPIVMAFIKVAEGEFQVSANQDKISQWHLLWGFLRLKDLLTAQCEDSNSCHEQGHLGVGGPGLRLWSQITWIQLLWPYSPSSRTVQMCSIRLVTCPFWAPFACL